MTYTPPTPINLPAGFEIAGGGHGYASTVDDMVELGIANRWTSNFHGNYQALIANQAITFPFMANPAQYPKFGALGTPPGASGWWVVESVRVRRLKAQRGVMTITWLGAWHLPTDTAEIKRENMQPRIERHPIFRNLTPLDFSIVQGAAKAPNAGYRNIYTQALAGTSDPVTATLLYNKFLLGEETYYFAGMIRYTWTTYYYYNSVFGTPVAPGLDPGGYTANPVSQYGAVPLFALLPATAQYLREADEASVVGGLQVITKFTRSWLGVAQGFWDSDLYS